ncbi:MAG: hypothetical protein JOZ43_02505 [Acidobacteriales bacterium]|nr:hypothetical protein [Terriglobales bacterium]
MDSVVELWMYWLAGGLVAGWSVLQFRSSAPRAKRLRDKLVPVTWAMILCAFSLGATAVFWVVLNQ